MQHSLQTDI